MRFCSVLFGEQKKQIRLQEDESSLLDSILAEGVDLSHSCGGNGTCGTCRLNVIHWGSQGAPPRNEIESELSSDRGFKDDERLACQILDKDAEGSLFSLP